MGQMAEHHQQARREARHYGTLVGYAGGILAVLQVSASSAAFSENQPTVLTLQRSLVNLSLRGGANPIPSFQQLGPMWLVAGGLCFIVFVATLWLAGIAGRIATIATGDRTVGSAAGARTALLTSGIWLIISLLAAAIFHIDAGFSWLITTITLLIASSASHVPSVLLTAPDGPFIATHLTTMAITHLLALLITWGFGALAGGFGASTAPRIAPAAQALSQSSARSAMSGYPPFVPYPYGYLQSYRQPYMPYPHYPPQPPYQLYPLYPPHAPSGQIPHYPDAAPSQSAHPDSASTPYPPIWPTPDESSPSSS